MKPNEAQSLLDGFLEDLTSRLSFCRAEPLVYARPAHEATALLSFPYRLDARGPCCFACNVWLRFEVLEQHLGDAAGKPTDPTISMPLHLLRENKTFTEWQFSRPENLESLRETILIDLRRHALPFIEKYSKLAHLRSRLESPSARDWFVLDPEQRVGLLAVIRFVQGDKTGALETLDHALTERETGLPKKRLPIEAVRKRLTELT